MGVIFKYFTLCFKKRFSQNFIQCFGNAIYYHRHQSHYHILPLGTTHYHLRKKKFVVVKCPRNWPFFDIPQGTTGVLFMVPELTTTGFEAWGRSTFSRFLIVTWPKYGSTCVCVYKAGVQNDYIFTKVTLSLMWILKFPKLDFFNYQVLGLKPVVTCRKHASGLAPSSK